ncbi:hypothetical protein VTL71DRAFT_10243 [Oculimacula yallundae]|uniref:Alpha/beta-hydrolase n=1 Tax=Oculimacula yallundae TaxID=86028 RepID=A0ABR4CV01_9HELO
MTSYFLALLSFFSVVTSAVINGRQSTSVGSGRFAPAAYTQDNTLTGHTLFAPKTVPSGVKMPVLLWGNGGCSADSLQSAPFLIQLASHGILVIASGTPKGSGSTTAAQMTAGIDWIKNKAGTGAYANVDASRIIAAGWSCGGVEAYAQAWDSRVQSLGIWSSGLLTNYTAAGAIKKPVFYFMGGSGDMAYANAERDYKALPAGVPKWKGNLNVGHGGTYTQTNGGKFGIAGGYWLDWLLRGDTSAASYFTGAGAKNDGWSVESANLDKIAVTPI